MIALATVKQPYTKPGTQLQFEVTVEALRHRVNAKVVKLLSSIPNAKPRRLRSELRGGIDVIASINLASFVGIY